MNIFGLLEELCEKSLRKVTVTGSFLKASPVFFSLMPGVELPHLPQKGANSFTWVQL